MHRHVNLVASLGFIALGAISPNSLQQRPNEYFHLCSTDVCIGNASFPEKGDTACPIKSNSKFSKKVESSANLIRQAMRRAAVMISEADNLSESNLAFSELLAQEKILLVENNSLASKTISIAENFYAIIQDAWFKGYKHGSLEIAINPSIRQFNKSAGFIVVPEIKASSVVYGVEHVSKQEYLSAIEGMKSFVAGLLKEGSVNEQEIINFFRYKSFLSNQKNPWTTRKMSDPNLKEWALANPNLDARVAEKTRDKSGDNDINMPALSKFYPLLTGLPALNPLEKCF